MSKAVYTCIMLLLAVMANGQDSGIRLLPELGHSFPGKEVGIEKVTSSGGLKLGVNAEKMWGQFGVGLYGGIDKKGLEYVDRLPSSFPNLDITRSNQNKQNHFQHLDLAIGPIARFNLGQKFDLDITSKLGFSKVSYPDFSELLTLSSPINQQYTLYETKNDAQDGSLQPMLLSALRLNFKISKRVDLTISTSYKHVRDVEHAYQYLEADFNPAMTSGEFIGKLENSSMIEEKRKCHFNSFGLELGVGYTFSPKEKDKPNPDTIDQDQPQDSCLSSLIRNEGFIRRLGRNTVAPFWSVGYGNPKFLRTPGVGFLDVGHVEISGNQPNGSAISQTLDPNNKFILGRNYVVTIGVRFQQKYNTLDFARIRAIAYNGSLPATGLHPDPSQNVAIIGRSGKIKDCGDWYMIEFPTWRANKNFDKIAINVFTNDGTSAVLWLDNVSVCEVSEGYGCDTIQLDANNKPIFPPGYGNMPTGFSCKPEEEEDTYDNGTLQDLYGQLYGYDGTTNWYANATDKCWSLGGTIPAEVLKYNCDDSLKAVGIEMTCDDWQKYLGSFDADFIKYDSPTKLPSLETLSPDCETNQLPGDAGNMAFGGKDIIYIHGLELGHVVDRIKGKQGALANWPGDPAAFDAGGYYYTAANATWSSHIYYFALNKNFKNRYLVVSYNCSQRLDVAVHSVLTQIREAMESSKNVVVPDPADPRRDSCFARDYVIISQSTGAMVSDVLLSIANSTKTDPVLASEYGNIGLISDRCSGHIARRGAFTGSDLATILVALAQPMPGATTIATALLMQNGDSYADLADPNNYSIIRSSVLVDLMPPIARSKWGPYMNKVPVPVLTVSGGHPSFFSKDDIQNIASYGFAAGGVLGVIAPVFGPLTGAVASAAVVATITAALSMKYIVHPGFDDGVITTDCANARISTFLTPSTIQASSRYQMFDMGLSIPRASSFYLDQRIPNSSSYASGASPYLSPSGMVQPVSSYSLNPQYPNHYSFLQAASEHWIKKHPTSCCDYNSTAIGGSPNNEEQLVVNNPALFHPTNGIIHPSIISQVGETIKGRYIWVPAIKWIKKWGVYFPVPWYREFWIWRRAYHNMRHPGLYDCDYVYQYLFKN